MTWRRPSPVLAAALALSALGCRMDVQLAPGRDAAPTDAARDAPLVPDAPIDAAVPPDAALDVGLDAPIRPCVEGVPLGAVAMTGPLLAPQVLSVGAGAGTRVVVLVPPSAAAVVGSSARLVVLDRDGRVLAEDAVPVASGGAALLALETPSTSPGEPAFALVLGDRLALRDVGGVAVGLERVLPEVLASSHQSAAARVSADVLVYVGESGHLVEASPSTGEGRVTDVAIAATDLLYVSEGSIVVNRGEPTLETLELDLALDGTALLHARALDDLHAGRVLGAARIAGTRRWLAKGPDEFRSMLEIFGVAEAGTWTSLAMERVVAPLVSLQRQALVAIETSDGRIVLADLRGSSFRVLRDAGPERLASFVLADDEILLLTLAPGDPDAELVLRCGP